VLLVAFVVAYYTGRRAIRSKRLKKLVFQLSHAASQIRVRGTILLILTFVVISQFVGAEIILGAFLAGIVLSIFLAKQRSSLIIKLDGMGYGFFIPVFFVIVGAKLDFSFIEDLGSSLVVLSSLLVLLYLVKMLPSLIWSRFLGIKKSISNGILLSSRLSLIIAAAEIGKQLEIVTTQMNAVIVIAAIFTCFISPFIYSLTNQEGVKLNYKTVVIGGSSVGVLLARRMKMHGIPVLIIEINRNRYKEILNKGMQVLHDDGCSKRTFEKIKLQENNYVLVTTGSYQKNYEICKMLKQEFNHDNIVTRLNKQQAKDFADTGIIALDQLAIDASAIENLILRPTTYHALMESFESYAVEEIQITRTSIDGKQVKDLPFHKDGNLILLKRKDKLMAPHGNTYLKLGDTVSVIGNDVALEDFRKKLS
jgi:Trk K+ transport system NAD-binding subunit